MRWGVITIHIKIGGVRTLDVENWQTIPDDRQQLVEIIGGVAVQDFGHIEEGDKISCNATLTAAGWETVKSYWDNRTLVPVEDESGRVFSGMRVVVKSFSYVQQFARYYKVSFEFWRV